MKKLLFLLLAPFIVVTLVFAAGKTEDARAVKKTEIDFQVWVTPNLMVEYGEELVADFEIGVFVPPTKEGTNCMSAIANRGAYAVSAKSKHPKEAIALAKYMGLEPYALFKSRGGLLRYGKC